MFKFMGRKNGFVMVALLVWALGEGLWYNLRQIYLDQLGATPEQIGTVLMLEAFGRALLPIPAGLIADRIGPFRVMLASWIFGILGAMVLGLATTWQTVIPGIMLYGLSAFAIPAVSSYTLLSLPDRTLPGINERALTTLYAAYPVGLIISPVIGGLVAESWGIRTTLWIGAVMFTLSLLVMARAGHVEPEPQTTEHHPLRLLRNWPFMKRLIYFGVNLILLLIAFLLIPNFLNEVRGVSLAEIGILFSVLSAGTVLVNLAAGRIGLRWGFASVLVVCWLALAGIWQVEDTWGIRVSFFLLGAVYTVRTFGSAAISRVVAPQNRALAFGLLETFSAAATAIAAQSAGHLYAATAGHDLPLVVALAGIPVTLGVWFLFRAEVSPVAATARQPAPGAQPGGLD